ncbi:MAG: pyrroloquinoline quinone precursor peptide PqqA [Variovorax paradoxus]|nr:MAG: pyrroloquinoline quinone precursor peptide PqqA [Variovorax paradoxus]PZQ05951.1 MAG: pyrroloquinoline quinone precursor peptide PqqA [Variovorax paradoxus]
MVMGVRGRPACRRLMKIMNCESRFQAWARAGRPGTMPLGTHRFPQPPPGAAHCSRRHDMQWQPPTATDLRFGFEITMYVTAR